MAEADIMGALRRSYREVQLRNTFRAQRESMHQRSTDLYTVRRWLRYIGDALDIILDIQRDRRWRRDYRDEDLD